jgi:UDP-glucose:glycoprotein glucosyltransferase
VAAGHFADCSTDRDLYGAFVRLLADDGHLAGADALAAFRLALALHAAAPRIQAHYQYYATSVAAALVVAQDGACPAWVHLAGRQYCSPALERAQQDFAGPTCVPGCSARMACG